MKENSVTQSHPQSQHPAPDSPAGSARLGGRSLTSAVYERLRAEIIANRLPQGEKLPLAQFQEQFGVSLSVVREALSRLAAEGLVVAEAQRGFRVSPISKADLIDVTRTRIAIEGLALQLAIAKGDSAWQAAVEQTYERMRNVMRATQRDQWAEAHARFHRLLVAPCDSPWLLRFRDILFEQAERYRYAAITGIRPPKQAEIDAQHRALVDAVLQRNPAKAQMAIDAHFTSSLERTLESLAPQ
ncbi:MAG: GntR family transcriptional regulator [Rubrivivax sp.]